MALSLRRKKNGIPVQQHTAASRKIEIIQRADNHWVYLVLQHAYFYQIRYGLLHLVF